MDASICSGLPFISWNSRCHIAKALQEESADAAPHVACLTELGKQDNGSGGATALTMLVSS